MFKKIILCFKIFEMSMVKKTTSTNHKENQKKEELDFVFEKLMVSPIQNSKRIQNEIRLHGEICKSIKKRKKKNKEKHLLHRPKLVLRQIGDESENSDEFLNNNLNNNEIFIFSKKVTDSMKRENNNNWNCSTQFLNKRLPLRETPEDSNPEELASYFEQLLYIPKPMSYMAEMMYA
nr:uncharacterized protein LOC101241383 [Hydra vulgaris]